MTPLLTLPQAASLLQVSPRSVQRLVDARQVRAFRTEAGTRKKVHFPC